MIKSHTKYVFILYVSVHVYKLNGQQMYFGLGVENAQFNNYQNSNGVNTLVDTDQKTYNLFFEAGYRHRFFIDDLSWSLGFSYNNYTINTGFISGNSLVPLTYELTYVSIKPGVFYTLVNSRNFRVLVHANLSHDWLVKGTSTYSNVTNNLYADNTFDKTLISFHRGVSVEYSLSDTISAYAKYNNASSFREDNQDSVAGEKYSLLTNAFSLGIIYNVTNRRRIICHGSF